MPKKKGRKKKSELSGAIKDPYFGQVEENAVVRYISSTDPNERSRIYDEFLRKPINTMVESIIRRYKLYLKGYTYEEIHQDALSFLSTKMDRFDITLKKKSYSYYGTIIKNYLLGKIIKQDKEMRLTLSYEDIYLNIEENERYSYMIEKPEGTYGDFIDEIIGKIETKINTEGSNLSPNEIKVGYALIDILSNWETIFRDDVKESDKFNKNKVLSRIREYTLLNTKDIRTSMKKYKEIYGSIKLFRLDEGLL